MRKSDDFIGMKGFKKLLAAAACGILALHCGCGKQQPMTRPPTPVVSTTAIAADVPLYIEAIGYCVAGESVNIVPQVSGQIIALNFTQGQSVKVGDPLCTIDGRAYAANLEKAEAQLEMAKARLKVDSAQLERSKALVSHNYISQQQYENYGAQVEQDTSGIASALAQMRQAKIDLEHCTVTSPINGIAGAYLVDVGNVVAAMSVNKPLVTVENIDSLYVEFSISENDFPKLQRFFSENGGRLSVEVSAISDGEVRGEAHVEFIDNSINRKTGSVKLRALMPNADHRFWPGQSVRAKILLTTLRDAVLVASEAVKLGQQGRYAFVIGGDKSVELRLVDTGQLHGNMLLIANGLKAGELVVQRGQLMLAPGMKVVEMPDSKAGIFEHDLEKNKKIAERNPTTK
ncbi:MAG: efflux RND transporter periplasmic adaptor subunit [Puniceicoccales bacterium]|jgi:multidrug efflux system membrane fusion protein|nr:efflux RND transporter periplasmic adaptor subunit [Puniceicoccales bacterium]